MPKLLHFFKKVTTLFEKVTTFYLMILLKIKKLLYFPKSRAHIEKPRAHRCGRAHQFGNPCHKRPCCGKGSDILFSPVFSSVFLPKVHLQKILRLTSYTMCNFQTFDIYHLISIFFRTKWQKTQQEMQILYLKWKH